MLGNNLSKNVKIDRVENGAAAGTSDLTSDSVDMQGFNGCMFVIGFGAITASAVTSVHAETSSDDSTFNDLAGSEQTVADDDDNQLFVIDIYKPLERYLRVIVDRGTQNAVLDGITAILYDPIKMPTTHATEVNVETHISPAEGTK